MRTTTLVGLFLAVLAAAASNELYLQSRDRTLGNHLQQTRINSKALAGNLIGDPSLREMAVLLPPSYFKENRQRFPVVYLLHGLGKRSAGHLETSSMFPMLYNQMKDGSLLEMILVAVDGSTRFGGSYYSNSPTIGNFEDYITQEIVPLVDSLYRTHRAARWRAIGGFSMGGYGAIKLAMKNSNLFSQVGSLSGSPLSIRYRRSIYRRALQGHKKAESLQDLLERITFESNWSLAAAYAKAAAFSPNPSKPPLYIDLPFESSSPGEDDSVWQRWWDDDPLSLVTRYQRNLRALDQIYMDHGDDETTLGTEDFDRELVRYGISHNHYIYRGDHVDNLPDRYLRMLRSFAVHWRMRG